MAQITKEDLLEYKHELQQARQTIIDGKPQGVAEIDKKVEEYRKELIEKYDEELLAEVGKCDIELKLIDRLIAKADEPAPEPEPE